MKRLRFALFIIVLMSAVHAEVEEYVLQAGDVISVNVVEHPEFSGRHKIRPDGRINYPVIGEIDVASLTCAQLVKIMQGKLSSYVNNPVVSVSIEAYYANKIYVIGAVSRGGEYQIYEPIDLLKVIAMCGGLQNNKTKGIKIIRSDGTVISVNTAELWNSAKYDAKKYVLYPGDTMYVPETFQVPWHILSAVLGVLSVSLQIVVLMTRLSS
ncbi:MAG: polysaccharide biosynthesis/export family protein [Chitinispirillaceae bacterium]|nr:polysaccharide biosynthesis/export family protein [Chitinispirillaceae bacterium]